jgi:hypothetical protein
MGVWYATREDVKSGPDIKETAHNNAQVDRAIEAASRSVEGLLHRRFYPELATKYFEWPAYPDRSESWKLWLNDNELFSVATLVSGGVTISAADYFLEPQASGPPYNRIELDKGSSSSFTTGSTSQRNIAVTGVFCGCDVDELVGCTSAEALDTSETGLDVGAYDPAVVGVGSIIKIDDERMIVTGKQSLTTGQTLGSNIAANQGITTVAVQSGATFSVGERILLDAEYMTIVDIAGNNLIVKRAVDGSTLAAHPAGATVYAPRTLVVQRGALGTTAATHVTSSTVYVFQVPGPVRALCVAEALVELSNTSGKYATSIGSGEAQREARFLALKLLRESVYTSHGRKGRMRSV